VNNHAVDEIEKSINMAYENLKYNCEIKKIIKISNSVENSTN